MRKPLFIFILFSALFLSCKKEDEPTRELKAYLKETFNAEPVEGAVYLLLPANQCEGCIRLNGDKLPGWLRQRLYVISPFGREHLGDMEHYLYDKDNLMQALKLLDYGNKLVFFNGGKVSGIVTPDLTRPFPRMRSCGAAQGPGLKK